VDKEKRCPICGEGILQHLGTEASDGIQQAETSILETYSCGHTVTEGSLATADAERLEVERRRSEDVVPPEGT
jgi:hypothetical protein